MPTPTRNVLSAAACLLTEPLPAGGKSMAQALGEHARGAAYARTAKLTEARAALTRAEAGAASIAKAHVKPRGFDRTLREMTQAATARLRAEIAIAEGRADEALKAQAAAVTAPRRAALTTSRRSWPPAPAWRWAICNCVPAAPARPRRPSARTWWRSRAAAGRWRG